jgi:hypothetical protein
MILNKRGVIGKVIVTFPLILAIFFLMVIFVVMAVFANSIFGIDKASIKPESVEFNDKNLLLQEIDFEGKRESVFVASNRVIDGELDERKLSDLMSSLTDEDGEALFLKVYRNNEALPVFEAIGIRYSIINGNGRHFPIPDSGRLRGKLTELNIKRGGDRYKFEYYFGSFDKLELTGK